MFMLTADPSAPSPADAMFARESARLLERSPAVTHGTVRLRLDEPNAPNEAGIVPAAAFRLLLKIINDIADLLNCSRPHAIKLLDEGRIPSHRVGTHLRAHLKDVMEYREEHYKARKAILNRMSAIGKSLGWSEWRPRFASSWT